LLKVRIPLRQGVLDATLCDKICQWLATDQWFSPGNPVYSTNKTDSHDITEILLKVALNTIKPKSKKSDGQQSHQYQQNKQSPLISNHKQR